MTPFPISADTAALYRSLTAAELQLARAAFMADRNHPDTSGKARGFCGRRIALIDHILAERTTHEGSTP